MPLQKTAEEIDAVIERNYRRANSKVVASGETSITDGTFSASLEIPASAQRGTIYVKAYAVGQGRESAVTIQSAIR